MRAHVAQTVFRRSAAATSGGSTSASATTGRPYFLEINALPSLEPGAGIYAAAALEGLHVDARARRGHPERGAPPRDQDSRAARASRPAAGPRASGFTFNVKRVKPDPTAARRRGGRVRQPEDAPGDPRGDRLLRPRGGGPRGRRRSCPACSPATPVDVVFNIAEGFRGRNRESPGAGAARAARHSVHRVRPRRRSRVALDKALAKRMVRTHGMLTPDFS